MKYKYDANYCSSSWTKLLALCFHGKALSAMEALVEILFDLYKQTTVVYTYVHMYIYVRIHVYKRYSQ